MRIRQTGCISQSVKGLVVQRERLSILDSNANGTLLDKTKMAHDKMLVYEQSGQTTNPNFLQGRKNFWHWFWQYYGHYLNELKQMFANILCLPKQVREPRHVLLSTTVWNPLLLWLLFVFSKCGWGYMWSVHAHSVFFLCLELPTCDWIAQDRWNC